VLYVNRRTKFAPYLIGGGQENNKRAGTQNVASIVALGKAAKCAGHNLDHEKKVVRKLRDDFRARRAHARSKARGSTATPSIGCPTTANLAF